MPTRRPATPTRDDPLALLLAVRCAGARCAALTRLAAERHDRPEGALERELGDAVRSQSRGVLVSAGCLGACHLGAVAAVGPAVSDGGRLGWVGPPDLVDRIDRPERLASLLRRVRAGDAVSG